MVNQPKNPQDGIEGAIRSRCTRCHGTMVASYDRRGGQWWKQSTCLMCGREGVEAPIAEALTAEQRLENKALRIPGDLQGWKTLLERRELGGQDHPGKAGA